MSNEVDYFEISGSDIRYGIPAVMHIRQLLIGSYLLAGINDGCECLYTDLLAGYPKGNLSKHYTDPESGTNGSVSLTDGKTEGKHSLKHMK